jgi:leader peptidase (prepilin peptidase)/N-methyltransferase
VFRSAIDVRHSARRLALGLASRCARPAAWFGLVAIVAAFISIVAAPGLIGLIGAGLALVMLAIAVIDFRSFTIPNSLNAAGFGLAIINAAVQQPDAAPAAVASAVLRGATFALVLLAIRVVYARLRGRHGLGFGDVKLAGVAGAWLDWTIMPIALELAACAALIGYMARQLLFRRSLSAFDRVPFGFFFAPAIWICWLIQATWPELF